MRAFSVFFFASFRSSPLSSPSTDSSRLLPVAVVRLVVQDEDPFQAHQLGHHAQQDFAVRLAGCGAVRRVPAGARARRLTAEAFRGAGRRGSW